MSVTMSLEFYLSIEYRIPVDTCTNNNNNLHSAYSKIVFLPLFVESKTLKLMRANNSLKVAGARPECAGSLINRIIQPTKTKGLKLVVKRLGRF